MTDTIKDKIHQSTAIIFRENLNSMVEFGLITSTQKKLLDRILCSFKYGKGVLEYNSLDIFFRYNPELFDKEFLDKIGNPKKYNVERSEDD